MQSPCYLTVDKAFNKSHLPLLSVHSQARQNPTSKQISGVRFQNKARESVLSWSIQRWACRGNCRSKCHRYFFFLDVKNHLLHWEICSKIVSEEFLHPC